MHVASLLCWFLIYWMGIFKIVRFCVKIAEAHMWIFLTGPNTALYENKRPVAAKEEEQDQVYGSGFPPPLGFCNGKNQDGLM